MPTQQDSQSSRCTTANSRLRYFHLSLKRCRVAGSLFSRGGQGLTLPFHASSRCTTARVSFHGVAAMVLPREMLRRTLCTEVLLGKSCLSPLPSVPKDDASSVSSPLRSSGDEHSVASSGSRSCAADDSFLLSSPSSFVVSSFVEEDFPPFAREAISPSLLASRVQSSRHSPARRNTAPDRSRTARIRMPKSGQAVWDRASRFGGGVFSLRDGGDDRESVANLVNKPRERDESQRRRERPHRICRGDRDTERAARRKAKVHRRRSQDEPRIVSALMQLILASVRRRMQKVTICIG